MEKFGIYKIDGYYWVNTFTQDKGWRKDVFGEAVWIEKWGFKNLDEVLRRVDVLNKLK